MRIQNCLMLFTCLGMVACTTPGQTKSKTIIYSPDKKIAVSVYAKVDRSLAYSMDYIDGKSTQVLLEASPLGLQEEGGRVFGNDVKEIKVLPATLIAEKYSMLTGKAINLDYKATEQKIVVGSGSTQFTVTFRVFNDGAAFRYELPGSDSITIDKELSGFAIPVTARLWMQQYDKPSKWAPAYENYYENDIAAGTPSPGEEGWCMPVLAKVGDNWLHIAEAGIDENYFSVHLQYDARQKAYIVRAPEQTDGAGYGLNKASFRLPGTTAWRCISAGNSLQAILGSNLVFHVSKPSVVKDISWIKPGISSWSWWSNYESSRDFDSLRNYVDFSAQMHWPYTLVDANWNIMAKGNVEMLSKYAATKNVGVWLWYNSGGPNNTVTEMPRDRLFDPVQRRKEFAWLQKIGIKGIKIDFFQSDKQVIMNQYMGILKDAATYHLLINFHGCTMPKGWSRTYPHLLSQEAVAGAECYGIKEDYPVKAPVMNTIYPFTRNVVGGMDYTPICFTEQKFPHKTSNTHELALGIVFETGILHPADKRAAYLSTPDAVQQLLVNLPVAWDEVKFLAGFPGKDLVLARRKGSKWFIAGINAENKSKTLSLAGFLAGKKVRAMQFEDDQTGRKFVISQVSSINNEMKVMPYGGFIMVVE